MQLQGHAGLELLVLYINVEFVSQLIIYQYTRVLCCCSGSVLQGMLMVDLAVHTCIASSLAYLNENGKLPISL